MKKILSAILAVAMIASMSAVAFAAQPETGLPSGTGATMTSTNAAFETGSTDGDDNTVKVDDNKAYFPVVGMVGPYGYYADDKVLFDAKVATENGSEVYYAPVEFGDTAYYALIQYIPKTGAVADAEAAYEAIKGVEAADGRSISDTTTDTGVRFANNGWYTVVTESETVSSLKIKQDWEEGDDLVKSVSIVKKKVCNVELATEVSTNFEYSGDDSDDTKRPYPSLTKLGLTQFGMEKDMYCYFLAIKYEDSTSHNDADVVGTVTLSKSKDPAVDKLEIDLGVNVDWENSYRQPGSDYTVSTDVELEAGKNYALKFEADDEVELTFDNDSYFEVDVSGQSKMLFSYNTDYISRIAAKYPYAELNFWNGNGAKFNRVGQMFLSCEDLTGTQFLYQVTSDGKLKEVPGAEWDDSDEGFYFNTRVLGSYVISDMELDVVEDKVEVNNTVVAPAPVITNPSTGAIA